jgi:PAS domain S-box-containing protein
MVERMLSPDLSSLEQLVLHSPDAVLVYDGAERRYVVANVAAEQLLGYTREEISRLHPGALSHPDDAEEIPSVIAAVERDGSVRRPWRARCKDGSIVATELTLTRTIIDGRAVSQGIFRVLENGGADQQANGNTSGAAVNRLAHGIPRSELVFLDRTGLTVVALDRDGIVTYWNAAAVEQYGIPEHEAVGQPVLDLAVTDEARTEVEALLRQHQTSDEWVSKLTIRPRNGPTFEAMVTGSALRSDEGELMGFLFVTAPLEPNARASAPRMRRARVQCAACGREVAGTMRRKYCSEKCRQWAYYHRHLDAQRARSRERYDRRRTDDQAEADSDPEGSA